ncbi:hypothetical protein RRG08_048710 [Elysia crispata]|uniref:WD repeat-containing protein 91 n=1 Tax=Elysia crispata TaxID=231223 RepID=A0AAE1A773_9GAST|nr:hypothetical protein RRG08_048710 [Elysia crispata]
MAASCEKLDQLVKDYLLFRGFTSTLKALDQELKTDKDKGLRVDRMMEQIWSLLAVYDLQGLRDYWRYLNQRLFARLEQQRYAPSIRKLESSILKLYIVNAHQCGRQDKVLAFFEQMGPELQANADFKDWFAFPFIAAPADNPMFSLYFNKQWQDTLQLSLHNFLSVVLQAMPVPTLLNVEFDARRMKSLQEENISLKQQLMGVASKPEPSRMKTRRTLHSELYPISSTPDMVYDFSGLSSDVELPNQEKQKTTRRFPLSLTSPLTSRKKSTSNESGQMKGKPVASVSGYVNTSVQASGIAAAQSSQTDSKRPQGHVPSIPAISSFAASSSTAVAAATAVTKHSTSSTGQSKTGATSKSFLIPGNKSASTSSASASDSSVTSEAQLRSFSTPSAKPASSRIPMVKQVSESVSSSSVESATSATTNVNNTTKHSKSALERSSSPAPDPNSPFLSLEDEYSEHTSAVSFCRFSLSGQYVASLDVDGIVKVWIWSPQPATTATVMSKSAFLSLAWAGKSDRWLLLGNKTGTIRLFDVKESKTYREVTVNSDNETNCLRVTDLSSSPSGQQFVCATADHCPFSSDIATVSGKLLLWDLRSLKLERTLVVDSPVCNAITCSSYNQTGHLLLTGGADGFVRIYDVVSQQRPIVKWQAHRSPIYSTVFNGDKSVLTIGAHGKLCEWSLAKPGQPLTSITTNRAEVPKFYNGSPRTCLFSLDKENQYLLTCNGHRGFIYKMSTSPPSQVMALKSHPSPVVTAEWSPSPSTRVCLTGSADGKIRILTLLEVENGVKKSS